MSPPTVVWFRKDLRLADNEALFAAASRDGPVIPLYIFDEGVGGRPPGAASRWWLDKSLRSLAEDLNRLGAPLVLRRGGAAEVLKRLVAESGAKAVYWNRLYDQASIVRDTRIKADLNAGGVEALSFAGGMLNEPWTVKTGSGTPYRVFTPYWRAARVRIDMCGPAPVVKKLRANPAPLASDPIDAWALHPRAPDWSGGFAGWRPGETGALDALKTFLGSRLNAYQDERNRPDRSGTSRLSPHLHFGEISPRQIVDVIRRDEERSGAPTAGSEAFLREIGWRDFNYQLLFHASDMEHSPLNPIFGGFPWRQDRRALAAWQSGRTGYPIVDAGMRELWTTGWMHNRVRMIVASFLVKHLLLDWQLGERWFWDTLVDADLANNVAGWQWVAGSGADAAPYFRVFNPVLQGKKFDPDGVYVRRWVPELATAPSRFIHQPWRAPTAVLAACGIRLGVSYPEPIVDHAEARTRALAAYERIR